MNNTISIVSSLIIFLFPYIGRRWFNRFTLSSTVVSLGLLGTFTGIMFGLWQFSVEQINASIPQLLEGLKTAFLTSIAGMLSSLLLKLSPRVYGIPKETNEEETSAVHTMLTLLEDIRDQEKQTGTQLIAELRQMHQDSQEQTTLFSGQLLQINQREAHLNTEALIQALQKVINNFNGQISGQITQTLSEMQRFIEKQSQVWETTQEQNQLLNQQLQQTLQALQEIHQSLQTFLNKSVSLNFKQNETLTTQISQFGHMVKNTGEQMEQQMSRMEEKYQHELSEMEKFTRTLMSIIKKLSQDHTSLYKNADEMN